MERLILKIVGVVFFILLFGCNKKEEFEEYYGKNPKAFELATTSLLKNYNRVFSGDTLLNSKHYKSIFSGVAIIDTNFKAIFAKEIHHIDLYRDSVIIFNLEKSEDANSSSAIIVYSSSKEKISEKEDLEKGVLKIGNEYYLCKKNSGK